MKFKLKGLAFCLIICLAFYNCSFLITAADASDSNKYVEELEKIIQQSTTQYNDISLESRTTLHTYNTLMLELKKENKSNDVFPEYFAGAYVENNNTLTVLLTQNNEANRNHIRTISNNDIVNVRSAKYSYNELFSVKENIINQISMYLNSSTSLLNEDLKILLDSFVSIEIDDRANVLIVSFTELTDNKISTFKENFSCSEMIQFQNTTRPSLDNSSSLTTYYPGGEIYIYNYSSASFSQCSIGFRARRLISNGTYYYGFVTAGHACSTGDSVLIGPYAVDSAVLGQVIVSQMSSVDAAFVAINTEEFEIAAAGDNLNGNSRDYFDTTVYYTNVPVGWEIIKNGATTGRTVGEVTSSSYDYVTDDDRTIVDCVKTNYKADSGDSGGVVYSPWSDDDPLYMIVGIHIASSNGFIGIGRSGVAVKIQNIQNALNAYYY